MGCSRADKLIELLYFGKKGCSKVVKKSCGNFMYSAHELYVMIPSVSADN